MSVNPGWGGQRYIPSSTGRLARLRGDAAAGGRARGRRRHLARDDRRGARRRRRPVRRRARASSARPIPAAAFRRSRRPIGPSEGNTRYPDSRTPRRSPYGRRAGEADVLEARALIEAHTEGRLTAWVLELTFYELANVLLRSLGWDAAQVVAQLDDLRAISPVLVAGPDVLRRAAEVAEQH